MMGRHLQKSTVTKHQRGFFGRIWQIVFWLFQLTMIGLVAFNFAFVGEVANTSGELHNETDAALITGMAVVASGFTAIVGWFVWFLGTFILGLLMFATRGKLVTYDVEK